MSDEIFDTRWHLYRLLGHHFDLEELRTLCFAMGINYDDLPGSTRNAVARELVAYVERKGLLRELVSLASTERPNIDWSQIHANLRSNELGVSISEAAFSRTDVEGQSRVRTINLRPIEPSHGFYGRKFEIDLLRKYIQMPEVRFIVIVGRGGIGKTALAAKLFRMLELGSLTDSGSINPDGLIYLSALDTGISLERLYQDVGRLLGTDVSGQLGEYWVDQELDLARKVELLVEQLENGRYYILLDNLENCLDVEGRVEDEALRSFLEICISRSTSIRLVATTRFRPLLPPSIFQRVRYLHLKTGLLEDDAIEMLIGLDPQGELGLFGAPRAKLEKMVRLTRGIPYAIQRVAGILDRGKTSFVGLLENEDLFSEQVVENLVAFGYEQLEFDHRIVMEALSIFEVPVKADAITYLLEPFFPNIETNIHLQRLVNGYFVTLNRTTHEYSLHPLDKEHSLKQIEKLDNDEYYHRRELELRAAEYFRSIRKPWSELKDIDDLLPQLQEFEHLVHAEEFDAAFEVIEPIWFQYLFRWGHFHVVETLIRKIIDQLSVKRHKASALMCLGRVSVESLNVDVGIEMYNEALAVAKRIGAEDLEGEILYSLGLIHRDLGDISQSIVLHKRALRLANKNKDEWNANRRLGNLALSHYLLGLYNEAEAYALQALKLARSVGDRWGEGVRLGILGMVALAKGNFDESERYNFLGLDIARESNVKDRRGESFRLLELGRIALERKRPEDAGQYLRAAIDLDIKLNKHQALCYLGIAELYFDEKSAISSFESAIEECSARLRRSQSLFEPRYTRCTALAGAAVLSPSWREASVQENIEQLQEQLGRTLEICSAKGVVYETFRQHQLISDAGIQGLDPILEQLARYL